MRVGLVCPYTWDVPGGVQQHIRDLAEALIDLGHEVSVIARDARLDTIQRNGLRHISGDHEMRVTVIAKDDPADLDAQDVVSCALA